MDFLFKARGVLLILMYKTIFISKSNFQQLFPDIMIVFLYKKEQIAIMKLRYKARPF